MTKLSPALMEGTRPREPTKAAAPSLHVSIVGEVVVRMDIRNDISVEIRSDCDVKDPTCQRHSRASYRDDSVCNY
jgi:hypothetical protein